MHSPDNTVEANSEELMDFEINNTGADSSSTQLDTLAKQTDQLAKKNSILDATSLHFRPLYLLSLQC